jgi:tRNA pseudouridine32 synthase/23S rRNA pseudouridine746 synthase
VFQILYQTDNFIVVNKPAGLSVHKDQQASGFVMQLCASLGIEQLYPVHRLDKVTSGVMLLALNSEAAAVLSALFRERRVEKYYLAVSDRKPRRKQGAIIGDMEKARRGSWKLSSSRKNPAITQFFSRSIRSGLRLFLLKPTTGKTHQIRVALKSEGAPILGDPLYSRNVSDRTYLHAYYLGFVFNGEVFRFTCLPEGEHFDEACRSLINEHYAQPEDLPWPKLKSMNSND